MNLNSDFGVSPGKVSALQARMARLGIRVADVVEDVAKGGGPGGAKTNAVHNAVKLSYPPLELEVRCREDRRLCVNRFLALRELVDRIEERTSPSTSRRLKEADRKRNAKARAGRRNRQRTRLRASSSEAAQGKI
jgi:protein subunit release factor B